MGTVSKNIHRHGYCPVDKTTVSIPVSYYSAPQERETRKNTTFFKSRRNDCVYLTQGKCNLGLECPIYVDAPSPIQLDISDMYF